MTEDQATFFDRIYPTITRRLQDLEDDRKNTYFQITDLKHEIKLMKLTVEQYKAKIQKIEQALINHGLKRVLKGIFE
ncbi:MAG: hypothetical protein KGI25_04545 [Thaumarchaeota archaeon]|nr:hypothetical protein [Nitrososphaerota archaeon]